MDDAGTTTEHQISVVVPLYQGERTLAAMVAELEISTHGAITPDGIAFRITEIVLVHDNGPDRSDTVMLALEAEHPFVRLLWLSRNFGQHDPRAIEAFLDTAVRERAGVVYARFINEQPHGFFRSAASRSSKRLFGAVSAFPDATRFQSYRLVRGDVGRHLAEFAATGVYLDVALSWVTNRVFTTPTELRSNTDRASGYSIRGLFSYFWRMVLTSGTAGLRIVSVVGGMLALIGVVVAIYMVASLLAGSDAGAEGWA